MRFPLMVLIGIQADKGEETLTPPLAEVIGKECNDIANQCFNQFNISSTECGKLLHA